MALLDVLGARSVDKEVTQRLYEQMAFLQQRIRCHTKAMRKQGQCFIDHLPEPKSLAFGDTLLFLWKVGAEANWLPIVGQVLAKLFVDALERKVPLRGAVSYGYAQYDDRVALGPAVSDAAEWYEEVDALAIVATPRTGVLLDSFASQMGQRELAPAFLKHGAFELKRQKTKRTLWTISWPAEFRERLAGRPQGDVRREVLLHLSQFAMPYGTERKYYEALKVFDAYGAIVADRQEGQAKQE